MTPVRDIQDEYGIIGRERELTTALAVLGSGRHLLLEGPVGVGKTTVALAVCAHLGRPTVRVDGDDRYSESKLTGWFDPPLVLSRGYGPESFFPGPLVQAMRDGAVLFINELNRMPESVQNVLLPALDERIVSVPHIGVVHAADGFQVVATQNPVEYVATGHLSEALRDRFEHLALGYQDAEEEAAIVRRETGCGDDGLVVVTGCSHAGICNMVDHAVALTGETRIQDVIGGLHLLSPSAERLNGTVAHLRALAPQRLSPCHCTDLHSKVALTGAAPLREVGVGLTVSYA